MKIISICVFTLMLTSSNGYGQSFDLPAGATEVVLAKNDPADTASMLFIHNAPLLQIKGVDITGVRAYMDGGMHLFFRAPLSEACGSVVRASGAGQESVKTLALAALMSGRNVTVEITAEKVKNFCSLIYIRLDAP